MPMDDRKFQPMPLRDPRLAPYVASPQPAWLWSSDGGRILWCNASAAAALGIADPRLLEKERSPADLHRRQVAQLVKRLAPNGAPRLERLRGFGARLGQLMTCACSRFEMPDGETALLLIAMESSTRMAVTAAPPPIMANPIETSDRMPNEPSTDEPLAQTSSPAPQTAGADRVSKSPDTDLPAETSAPSAGEIDRDKAAELIASAPSGHADGNDEGPASASDPADAPDPLRFVWQIDAAGRFSLISDEFLRIAGERSALAQGLAWNDMAQMLALDPNGRIAQAIAKRETFSGVAVQWPLAGLGRHGPIELSGMPVFDGARNFAGFRGFGIYRPAALPADNVDAPAANDPVAQPVSTPSENSTSTAATPVAPESPSQGEAKIVEPPQNVVLFPLANDTRGPSLSAVENHAFDEIARRLTQGLEDSKKLPETPEPAKPEAADKRDSLDGDKANSAKPEQPAWLKAEPVLPRADSARDRVLLDLVPAGVLVYRLDRLLYANRAFLDRIGFESLAALQEAGGLDALYVEPPPAASRGAADEGVPLKIAPSAEDRSPADAKLFSISWSGETAHALILQTAPVTAQALPAAAPEPAPQPFAAAPAQADDAFEAMVETATDGIVLFDRSGAIISCNRSAETLFRTPAADLRALNFADLFAAESQAVVLEYFESLERPSSASPLDHGREVLGRERAGGFIPLSMTMGRIGADSERYFAVFRDLSQLKKNEQDLLNARRKAERATASKSDALTSISHEIRGPLNTVLGFANVMIEERFGPVGNERYIEYLKDIRASAERAIAILDDIVNISSIETGNVDLKLVSQNLNEMVEQCVGVLQPQANRERVIIRTSLAHGLPPVTADTQALRQITMNIVTSSIRCSKAGGQVIVSTAPADNGGAILRVRDTGRGLSETELASAMGSHRAGATDRSAIDLSLARALAEANRAQFQIKSTENSGTLIEVVFANVRALAG
ncbi:PAS domain-containing protein [Bradyrhizobium sp. LHD-71]|uniref:PAS domain-containing sensor histidine kinase n=1 Tax=Bradyrhizobium sp. LHD-71 TaxID=3072141 RepID=UPI00280FEC8E|nr:PAS domain-containing protein [Bradyrhizobium sp. LHD-71]MDQ8726936.1 PAS domain-containing protein [Bradyrhizobium sp. LHD-71]